MRFQQALIVALALCSAATQAAKVELISAFNITMSRYGMTSYSEAFSVAADTLSADQQVFVHHEMLDGTWVDIPLYYFSPAGGNKSIWKLSTSMPNLGSRFVVATRANGQTYWDNNQGANYQMQGPGFLLGNGKKVIVDYYLDQPTYLETLEVLNATIVVDNVAPVKNVKLIYSNDNWATSTTVAASYAGPYVNYGYGSYPNPSANNAETWRVTAEIPADVKGQFYVAYTAGGKTYYANNYGGNYKFNHDTLYDTMHVRTNPDWGVGQPMSAIADNLWAVNVFFSPFNNQFKFDVFNDWSVNFGDNEADGIADYFGSNIQAPSVSGYYRVIFNEVTEEYSVTPFNLNP